MHARVVRIGNSVLPRESVTNHTIQGIKLAQQPILLKLKGYDVKNQAGLPLVCIDLECWEIRRSYFTLSKSKLGKETSKINFIFTAL